MRLVRNKLEKYYLCISKPLEIRCDNQAPKSEIIALDPGVRTFVTGYMPDGQITEWAKNDVARIYRLQHTISKLQINCSQPNVRHRKRYKMKKAALRIHRKIRNIVDDSHKKLCKWLILLPEFGTQGMTRRYKRKIGKNTARALYAWSHYRFRMRLLNKIREYPSTKVLLVSEEYTSKTCGTCGHVH